MGECTSNENAVDDREMLLFFSFHVILNQCNFIDGYYFSGLWFLNSSETAIICTVSPVTSQTFDYRKIQWAKV